MTGATDMSSEAPLSRPGSSPAQQPLLSDYADDPDMLELVEMFVDEMPERVTAIEEAIQLADIQALSRLTHQLKGAAGGYGFGCITEAAGQVEQLTKAQKELDEMEGAVAQLLSLCRRASSNSKAPSRPGQPEGD